MGNESEVAFTNKNGQYFLSLDFNQFNCNNKLIFCMNLTRIKTLDTRLEFSPVQCDILNS